MKVCGSFGNDACLFMSLSGELLTRDRALASPLELAAANWVASALVVGRKYPNCILIDVGSTTTDLIPVKEGKPAARKTDLQRLRSKELVYTGVLRTPLSSICSEMRLDEETVGLATENFAITADVYAVLEMIEEKGYTCETPDKRGKDKKGCMHRIARTFCGDLEELGEDLVLRAAKKFHEKQVELLARADRAYKLT